MHFFYGIAFDQTNIYISITIFCILIFGFKILASRNNWKINIFVWIIVVFVSFIVTNVISSLI